MNDKIKYKMDELKNLVESCLMEVVYEITQKAQEINKATYVGTGKVSEIKTAINTLDADIVVFNNELSPAQIRNLEKQLDIKVIDRSLLILDIFARRAQTKEAMLEVELAQLKYMLPRLAGLNSSLSRQGGGFNAKGPGEKKLELDRRIIEKNIIKIQKELKIINIQHDNQKRKRLDQNIPIVALVGYTNAGKSATMNNLINRSNQKQDKLVFEENLLFATLSTSARKITLETKQSFILIDTVGFVSELPHHLVNSFKQTLSEILDAKLIIHVVDSSNEYYPQHIETTNEVLESIGCKDIDTIYAFNKADLLSNQFFPEYPNSILMSTKTNQNIDLLLNMIKETIFNDNQIVTLYFPYENANSLAQLEGKAKIIKKIHNDYGTTVKVEISSSLLEKYYKFKV